MHNKTQGLTSGTKSCRWQRHSLCKTEQAAAIYGNFTHYQLSSNWVILQENGHNCIDRIM